MCGRFTLTWPSHDELSRLLGVAASEAFSLLYRPRWNVAPTDPHWVVRLSSARGEREIAQASWGFSPLPAKNGARRGPLINARSETVARMPGVRDAFAVAARRCIVPVDGFYEWVGEPKAKRPIWFHARDSAAGDGGTYGGGVEDRGGGGGDLLRLAGLWTPDGTATGGARFTILTTAANDVVSQAHDRMPVILAAADVDTWLGADAVVAQRLLRPAPASTLAARAVMPRANSVKHDDPSCLDPWDPTLEVDLRDVKRSAVVEKTGRARSKIATLSLFSESPGDMAPPAAAPRRRRR